MTPNQTRDTFEDDLRAMLRARAEDVGAVPASTFAFERGGDEQHAPDVVTLAPRRERHRAARRTANRSPLLAAAAAVVAVLTAAGIVVAVHDSNGERTAPPAHTGTPTTTTPRPAPAVDRVTRSASLTWFAMDTPSGYTVASRESRPGYRSVALRKKGDDGTIAGDNGGSPYQTYVTVWDHLASGTVTGGRKVDLDGRTAYLGDVELQGEGGHEYPTLAFRSPRGRWVLVQGRTSATSTDAQLLAVARAVRPDETAPFPVPFRLSYAPPGSRVTETYADATGDYPTRLVLESRQTGSVVIFVGEKLDDVDGFDRYASVRRTVDGKPTYVVSRYAVAATLVGPRTVVGFQLAAPGSSDEITRAQRTALDRILAGVTWHAAQPVAAEQAVP
ncbi:hypothetical protein SAMN05443575_3355 [Jatrophihabitans endophyticus]|uniref:Uncharacterized protein n=1 Tax=Jatrophihabitans endophyticus TaxID=1206085 RepID=A0A1M5QU25_9ACTN|nr:hypothetical protein [Jatrophihabitans endophyticus]SHH17647.1 hypothetical protein SAMN05443575_3355 [Jatrophihabitans endophyticus]